MPVAKYKNQELAEQLYPIFRQTKTVQGVFDHCKQNGIELTKPTIAKMAHHFGWKKKAKDEVTATFSSAPSPTGNMLLDNILYIDQQKTEIRRGLKHSPLNIELNKLMGDRLKQQLDYLKELSRNTPRQTTEAALAGAVKAGGISQQTADAIRASLAPEAK